MVGARGEEFECTHGLGYTFIRQKHGGIETVMRMFVPREGRCEAWTLHIRNKRAESCRLKVVPYVKTALDGFYRPQDYDMGRADFDPSLQAVVGQNYGAFGRAEDRILFAYLMASDEVSGYDGRNDAFVGAYSEDSAPEAVLSGGCRNSACYAEKICFALENTIGLEPGEERSLHYLAGAAIDREEISGLRGRLLVPGGIEAEFAATVEQRAADIDGVTIETPDEGLNLLFNGFLKHQTSMGSRWARVRHNGFRDTNCDCECLGIVNPELAWKRAMRILSYQYRSGYAPRTFLNGRLEDRGYADNTVWITFNIYHLLKEIGELALLDQEVPFNDGTVRTVYEHVRRSVDYLWGDRGELGLIRIHGGDWNDCLNMAGLKGRGMSVWLSIAWFLANRQFMEIARLKGCKEDAERARIRAGEMRDIIDRHGWDGEYYLAAYDDEGKKIGSQECDEGRMHLIHQAWVVMAGADTDGKGARAMDAVEQHMMTDLGAVMAWPPYTYYRSDIGITTQKLPGVHENGSVYLHACTWKLAADAILKRADRVQEDIEKLLPANSRWAEKHCEPYIMCNSYYPKDSGCREGRPGQSWRTGTGAWFLKAIAFYALGLQPEMEGLRLNPCLPPDWKTCSVRKRFRGAEYAVNYVQPAQSDGSTLNEIKVNGEPLEGDILPWEKGGRYVVEVKVGGK
jgi:cellobiose phosphorylase